MTDSLLDSQKPIFIRTNCQSGSCVIGNAREQPRAVELRHSRCNDLIDEAVRSEFFSSQDQIHLLANSAKDLNRFCDATSDSVLVELWLIIIADRIGSESLVGEDAHKLLSNRI